MCPDPTTLVRLIQAAIAAFAILGGSMASLSGYFAARRFIQTLTANGLTDRVNLGIAVGFLYGLLPALGVAIVTFSS